VRLPILIAAAALGVAGAAAAQVPGPARGVASTPGSGPTQSFISPMGEPFRGKDGQPYPSIVWFNQADANHDGVISRSEFRADAQRFFKVLDVNGDGKISDIEIQRYETQVAPEIVAFSVPTDAPQDPGTDFKGDTKQETLEHVRQGASFFSVIDDAEPVRSADADFDNKVTLDEWMAAADRRYDLLVPDGKDGIRFADLPKTPYQIAYERQLELKAEAAAKAKK